MNTTHTLTPSIDDARCIAFTSNAYRSDAMFYDPRTGRYWSEDYSTPEQIARRAALAKVQA